MRPSLQDIYEQYAANIYDAAFSVTASAADAEDVLQETLIKYNRSAPEFQSSEHVKAWLIRTAINKAIDLRRSFWYRNRVSFEDYMDRIFPQESEERDLLSALMKLPLRQRTVLHLFYYEGYTVQQIAEILKIPAGTVKSRLAQGRKKMKTLLEEENE